SPRSCGGARNFRLATIILGDGSPRSGRPGGGAVVRGAVVGGLFPRLADVPGRVEIGLADLEVDDLPSLPLQSLGASQHLERRFCSQTGHALGEVHGRVFMIVMIGDLEVIDRAMILRVPAL